MVCLVVRTFDSSDAISYLGKKIKEIEIFK